MRDKRKRRFLLDRRVSQILAAEPAPGIGHNNPPPEPDELLTTAQVAAWLGVSVQFLEAGRAKGYGPDWMRLGPRATRYTRAAVRRFLHTRAKAAKVKTA
jgi:hypothetical protein